MSRCRMGWRSSEKVLVAPQLVERNRPIPPSGRDVLVPTDGIRSTILPAVALQACGHGISQYHGGSGAGFKLRQRVVETECVETLGVLVVSAARPR